MITRIAATTLALAVGQPIAIAQAQTNPPAASAEDHGAHHPAGQETTQPATPAPQPATPGGTAATPPTPAQMGMMMGDMRQMMGMMQQMMGMMRGGMNHSANAGAAPGGMMGGMMGGGMPMMSMMAGQQGASGPAMGMGPGARAGGPAGRGGPEAMFRHTEGILAFYKAELRIADAQAAPWNAFADAVRTHVKNLREVMQREMGQLSAAQRATGTVPEQLDRRVTLLTAQLDATKAVATAGKALYAALNPEQRKLADGFMADHLRFMRGPMP